MKLSENDKEAINHPQHYGGADNPYEAIKVIRAWQLDFCLGNTVKYIARAGKKDPAKEIEDLEKAAWYLNERIKELQGAYDPDKFNDMIDHGAILSRSLRKTKSRKVDTTTPQARF